MRIEHEVAHEVFAEVNMRPRNVVVLEPGMIPKTPSGKLRRGHALALPARLAGHAGLHLGHARARLRRARRPLTSQS